MTTWIHQKITDTRKRIRADRNPVNVYAACKALGEHVESLSGEPAVSRKVAAWLSTVTRMNFQAFDPQAWDTFFAWLEGLQEPSTFPTQGPAPLARFMPSGEGAKPVDHLVTARDHEAKIRARILIVEDDYADGREILLRLRDASRRRWTAHPFDVSFSTYPDVETGSDQATGGPATEEEFLDGLNSILMCTRDVEEDQFIQIVLLDYDLGVSNAKGDRLTAEKVARSIREKRPSIDLHLLTGIRFDKVSHSWRDIDFGRPFSKQDLKSGVVSGIFDSLLQELEAKYETPFWNAVRRFAQRPMITCHTLPLGFSQSIQGSRTLRDLDEFFNDNFFRAETSVTLPPLDSLLHPEGTLKEAQRRAAHAFGAERTLFVTNGTSTANKIVLQAILRAGDVVLVDRNCHISHHYGLVLARARPFYLEPFHLPELGIAGSIPLAEIERGLRQVISETGQPPAALLLTNCTFDGICINPESVILKVATVLRSLRGNDEAAAMADLNQIVFFFDEAWFAAARFDPNLVDYTAMSSVDRILRKQPGLRPSLRVYVTQSTHKSLSAVRQGSMIHIYDGTLLANDARGAAAERKIDQAYRAHTSTSPSATILSSLDLARRQVELEGTYLTLQCAARGRELRESIQHLNTNHGDAGIRVIEAGDLLSSVAKDISHSDLDRGTAIPDFALDPSRVTVAFPEGVTGSIVKKKLFSEYNIQINKYSHSTILLNMTIGMTYGNVWTVAQSLWQIGRESLRSAALAKSQGIEETRRAMMPPPFSGFHSPSRKVDSELAFYANNEDKLAVRLVPLHSCATSKGLVCADFVTPYPPGYPVLVPGQKITRESVEFLVMMGIDEIHGTRRTTSGALYVPIFEV